MDPTPHGTRWGIGGTCVNVGCIPKKLFHYSGLLGEAFSDARSLGWKLSKEANTGANFDWSTVGACELRPAHTSAGANCRNRARRARTLHYCVALAVGEVRNHIGSLNFGYRVQLREKDVKYINAKGSFVDPHTVECTAKDGSTSRITGDKIVIAVGGRPRVS